MLDRRVDPALNAVNLVFERPHRGVHGGQLVGAVIRRAVLDSLQPLVLRPEEVGPRDNMREDDNAE